MVGKSVVVGVVALGLAVCAGGCSSGGSPQVHGVRPDSAVMAVYLPRRQLTFPRSLKHLEKPYLPSIESLHVDEAVTSAFYSIANSTKWIIRMERGNFDPPGSYDVDWKQLNGFMEKDSADAVVVVKPLMEFTAGLKRLSVMARIAIEKNTPTQIIELKRRDFVETISLENAGLPLSRAQIASYSGRKGKQAAAARARLWFAHGGARIMNGVLIDTAVLARHARKFLFSPMNGT